MRKYSFILFLLFVTLVGCEKDNDLARSVFITDAEHYGLPMYSEFGYNTFGAYYDRDIIVSNDYEVPGKIIAHPAYTDLLIAGQKGELSYSYDRTDFSINFRLADFHPTTHLDLLALHNTTVNLAEGSNSITLKSDGEDIAATILSGTLIFQRAQHLFVDKEPMEVILSGRFEFMMLVDGEPISVTNGRFDLGFGTDNVFVVP